MVPSFYQLTIIVIGALHICSYGSFFIVSLVTNGAKKHCNQIVFSLPLTARFTKLKFVETFFYLIRGLKTRSCMLQLKV